MRTCPGPGTGSGTSTTDSSAFVHTTALIRIPSGSPPRPPRDYRTAAAERRLVLHRLGGNLGRRSRDGAFWVHHDMTDDVNHNGAQRPAGDAADAPDDVRADRGHVRVAIVGAGFTGLAMVQALRRAGIEDWIVLEKSQIGRASCR